MNRLKEVRVLNKQRSIMVNKKRMKKEKKKKLIFANIGKILRKLGSTVKSSAVRTKDKLSLNVNNTDNYGYVGLGPTNDAENSLEYMKAMEWALNEKHITNIALTGPYGAGKSSIIKTFLKKHPSIKYINISLAMFRKNGQEEINGADEEFEKMLEEGILKQLFYKVNYTKIPQSRYRKLHKVSFQTSFFRVICTLVLISSFTFLFAPGKVKEIIDTYSTTMQEMFGWSELRQGIFASILGLFIIGIMTCLFRWVNTKWKSIEINVADKATIKTDEEGDAFSLNKNMDEILYFFEETDYSFVVIEDIDRFDTPEVYIKLREINKIINDYDAISRRIIFVYALKDDIFHNEDRTKFFDFIIPVIPYVDTTNSGEYFRKCLDNLKTKGLAFNISNEYIMNIAPFISDMRVLNNICNEFIIFKKTIKDSQELNRLQDEQMLSMMILKNMYPREFAELQEAEGIIKKAYADRSAFIEKITVNLQKEVTDAEAKKKISDSQGVLDAECVKLAFIQKLIGDKGMFSNLKVNGKTYTRDDILKEDFSLTQIGKGDVTITYSNPTNYYNTSSYSFNLSNIELLKCSDGITFYEKCDRAIANDKKNRKQIVQNFIEKQQELYRLRSKSMKMLIQEYGVSEVLSEEVRKNKLVTFMLRHGYIDDTYQMYINYFLPGSITVDELNFILNIRNYVGSTDWDYRIIHPGNVIDRLFDYEFEQQKECLNFDIADYFYSDDKKSDKKIGFTKQLAKDDIDSRKFIKEYYIRAKNRAEFIRNLAQQKPLLWYDVCADEGLGHGDKLSYLKDIFMFLKVENIVLQNVAAGQKSSLCSIQSFIVESDDVIELLQEAGVQKVMRVLIDLKVKFKNIDLLKVDEEIICGIFANELYEITLNMLQKYADYKAGNKVTDFATNIYTYILKLEEPSVISYLEKNIRQFVTEVILPTEENVKEEISTVLKCIKLFDYDENLSIQIIQKMEVILEDFKSWFDQIAQKKDVRNIADAFLEENKVQASIANIDEYKGKYGFTNTLCAFIDDNIEKLLADVSVNDTCVKEILKQNINESTIEKILSTYKMEEFSEKLNAYRSNVVETMIRLKYFVYAKSRYSELLSAFPLILPLFAKHYWDEFQADIPSIRFDTSILERFLTSDLDDEKKIAFLKKVDTSQMTDIMIEFVKCTNEAIPKQYLRATWSKLDVNDRPAFMVKHFSSFDISEIQSMFAQMSDEYHSLRQENKWHEVLLKKDSVNELLLKKLKDAGYISSYDIKKEKKSVLEAKVQKLVARVKAKK